MIETIGNLRMIKELGHGGMGVVYLAQHQHLDKKFAVKSLSANYTNDSRFKDWFYQEANNQAILEHPNIVQVSDFHEEQGRYFLVMEYVSGEDLDQRIKRKGKLSEEEALPIMKDILVGLGFAHRKSMIHRDIKPSNIMVGKDGRARIMDFGLSVLMSQRLDAIRAGTPQYQSPEQIDNSQELDHRSDIYSLGIVFFEMLTGSPPFDGDTKSVYHQQIHSPVPELTRINPNISKELSQIVHRCVAKNRDQRFQGCDDLLNAIVSYEKRRTRRRNFLIGTAAISMACVVTVLAYGWIYQDEIKTKDKAIESARNEKAAQIVQHRMSLIDQICYKHKYVTIRNQSLLDSEAIFKEDPVSYAKLKNHIKASEDEINGKIAEINQNISNADKNDTILIKKCINKNIQTEKDALKVRTLKRLSQYIENDKNKLQSKQFTDYFCAE